MSDRDVRERDLRERLAALLVEHRPIWHDTAPHETCACGKWDEYKPIRWSAHAAAALEAAGVTLGEGSESRLVAFLANDALAMTYQTLGQYRSAALRIAAGEGSEGGQQAGASSEERLASSPAKQGLTATEAMRSPASPAAVSGEQRPRSEPSDDEIMAAVGDAYDAWQRTGRKKDGAALIRAVFPSPALHREGA